MNQATASQAQTEWQVAQNVEPDGIHWCVVRDGEIVAMFGMGEEAQSDAHLAAICVNAVQRLVTEVKDATLKLVKA